MVCNLAGYVYTSLLACWIFITMISGIVVQSLLGYLQLQGSSLELPSWNSLAKVGFGAMILIAVDLASRLTSWGDMKFHPP